MRIWVVDIPAVLATTMVRFLTETGHEALRVAGWEEFETALGENADDKASLAVLGHNTIARDPQLERLGAMHRKHPDLLFAIVLGGNPPVASVAFETGVFGYLSSPPRLAELELLLMRAEENRALAMGQATPAGLD